LYTVLRHNDAYRFNNIWLEVEFGMGADQIFSGKVNMPLGSDANGWFGIGMNDIWEHRHKINTQPVYFPKPGIYNFSVKQIMRENPLPNVLSAGLRVEKVN
jgi:gliding motility-associated lipoprotein GldH